MKLNETDIKKIEQFMHDEGYYDVNFMLESIKKIISFAIDIKKEILQIDSKGYLD